MKEFREYIRQKIVADSSSAILHYYFSLMNSQSLESKSVVLIRTREM